MTNPRQKNEKRKADRAAKIEAINAKAAEEASKPAEPRVIVVGDRRLREDVVGALRRHGFAGLIVPQSRVPDELDASTLACLLPEGHAQRERLTKTSKAPVLTYSKPVGPRGGWVYPFAKLPVALRKALKLAD